MVEYLDRLVMMLSTDWFYGLWPLIGLEVREQERRRIQQGCRIIVGQILGGAEEYWLASFSDQRRQQTYSLVTDLVAKSPDADSLKVTIREWVYMTDEEIRAGSLFDTVTDDLTSQMSEDLPRLSPEAIEIAIACRREQAPAEHDFDNIASQSLSEWDKYIAGVTPDVPTYLADTLLGFVKARDFRRYWTAVLAKSFPNEQGELMAWYRSVAKAIARRDLAPSYFGTNVV